MFSFIQARNPAPSHVDQQLRSRFFRLPAELRAEIYKSIVPSEITLQSPSDVSYYRKIWWENAGGMAVSCRGAMYEISEAPLPRINLRLPSLDEKTNMELGSFNQGLIPAVKSVIVESPNWVVRPDRFQWSADHDELWFDEANRFLDSCVNMQFLVIEVNGHAFTPLVDISLRNLKPLRTRAGVEVDVLFLKEPSSNTATGPTNDAIQEVISAIKGLGGS